MNLNYPKPIESLEVAKNDLKKWGYCLLKNSIPLDLNNRAMERLIEQANAEKELNLAYEDGSKKRNGVNLIKTLMPLGSTKEYGCCLIKAKYF